MKRVAAGIIVNPDIFKAWKRFRFLWWEVWQDEAGKRFERRWPYRPAKLRRNKYSPHQGKQEMARRARAQGSEA